MLDLQLSLGIVAWTGWGIASYPVRDHESLVATLGPDAVVDLLPRIRQAEEEFYLSDAQLRAPDIQSMGEMAAQDFRRIRPDVSDDAVKALAWCYTFDYK